MSQVYRRLCKELTAIPYDEDPASMGSTVGAPHDEYDAEAARLASSLRNSSSREEIDSCLRGMFGGCSGSLVERVYRALAKFRIKLESARRAIE